MKLHKWGRTYSIHLRGCFLMLKALLLLSCRTLGRRLHFCSSGGLFLFIVYILKSNIAGLPALPPFCEHLKLSHYSLLTRINVSGKLFAHWKLLPNSPSSLYWYTMWLGAKTISLGPLFCAGESTW